MGVGAAPVMEPREPAPACSAGDAGWPGPALADALGAPHGHERARAGVAAPVVVQVELNQSSDNLPRDAALAADLALPERVLADAFHGGTYAGGPADGATRLSPALPRDVDSGDPRVLAQGPRGQSTGSRA